MKIVSACLAGINCMWDGKNHACQKVVDMVKNGQAIPVCPEQLGGLPTPRIPAEQKGKKVFRKDGNDVTQEFRRGAEEAFKITKMVNCKEAILKARSPSCGSGLVYDGTFTHKFKKGNGVFATLLKENGIKVLTEEEI